MKTINNLDPFIIVEERDTGKHVLERLDGSFVLTEFYNGGYDHYIIDSSKDYEVLGNIYENVNLLECDDND